MTIRSVSRLVCCTAGIAAALSLGPAVADVEPAPTNLRAYARMLDAWVAEDDGLLGFSAGQSRPLARLTDGNGTPVAGRRIDFTRHSTLLCSGTTDANGYAACAAPETTEAFTAHFVGDEIYMGSTAESAGVRVRGDKVDAYCLTETFLCRVTVY